jgi:glycosyltransferase involved in cell wall biosynthesis
MYSLSVGAMFKNESHSIEEWLKHYLFHGVEHFYLIDDASTDGTVEILKPYIDKGLVTLFQVQEPYYLGRQRALYNRHILPLLKESQWLLMIDIDEYVWSPQNVRLTAILDRFTTYGQIQVREIVFGSNGHVEQPAALVPSFTKREKLDSNASKKLKYFLNSTYEFSSLNVHHADFVIKDYMSDRGKFIIAYPHTFRMNHYNCQSLDFWTRVKCTRGDADNYLVRTVADFKAYDHNDEEDLDLLNQNKELY